MDGAKAAARLACACKRACCQLAAGDALRCAELLLAHADSMVDWTRLPLLLLSVPSVVVVVVLLCCPLFGGLSCTSILSCVMPSYTTYRCTVSCDLSSPPVRGLCHGKVPLCTVSVVCVFLQGSAGRACTRGEWGGPAAWSSPGVGGDGPWAQDGRLVTSCGLMGSTSVPRWSQQSPPPAAGLAPGPHVGWDCFGRALERVHEATCMRQ